MRRTTINLSEATDRQIEYLGGRGFGSFTQIVRTAIDRMYREERKMTDEELIQRWREYWTEMEAEGGQSSDVTVFIEQEIEELERELQQRGLRPTYECTYAPSFCPYGCPGSRIDYWVAQQ